MDTPAFRMGKLDHVHIRVPNRAEAAAWYAEHLGFEPLDLIEPDGVSPKRYWPRELYDGYRAG